MKCRIDNKEKEIIEIKKRIENKEAELKEINGNDANINKLHYLKKKFNLKIILEENRPNKKAKFQEGIYLISENFI